MRDQHKPFTLTEKIAGIEGNRGVLRTQFGNNQEAANEYIKNLYDELLNGIRDGHLHIFIDPNVAPGTLDTLLTNGPRTLGNILSHIKQTHENLSFKITIACNNVNKDQLEGVKGTLEHQLICWIQSSRTETDEDIEALLKEQDIFIQKQEEELEEVRYMAYQIQNLNLAYQQRAAALKQYGGETKTETIGARASTALKILKNKNKVDKQVTDETIRAQIDVLSNKSVAEQPNPQIQNLYEQYIKQHSVEYKYGQYSQNPDDGDVDKFTTWRDDKGMLAETANLMLENFKGYERQFDHASQANQSGAYAPNFPGCVYIEQTRSALDNLENNAKSYYLRAAFKCALTYLKFGYLDEAKSLVTLMLERDLSGMYDTLKYALNKLKESLQDVVVDESLLGIDITAPEDVEIKSLLYTAIRDEYAVKYLTEATDETTNGGSRHYKKAAVVEKFIAGDNLNQIDRETLKGGWFANKGKYLAELCGVCGINLDALSNFSASATVIDAGNGEQKPGPHAIGSGGGEQKGGLRDSGGGGNERSRQQPELVAQTTQSFFDSMPAREEPVNNSV